MRTNNDNADFAFCNDGYAVCTSPEANWEPYETGQLMTNIIGQCASSAGARLAIPVWMTWLTNILLLA
jgi:hypothetical protein